MLRKRDASELPAAGKVLGSDGQTTVSCMAQMRSERPKTPEKLRKYRKSSQAPGGRTIHPGQADDVAAFREKYDSGAFGNGFGKITHDSSHVPETLEAGPQTKMGHFLQDRKEMIYETKRREPLGKSYVRGQMLPERVTKESFAFGKGSSKSNFDAKELIYPKTVAGQEEKHHDQYVRSHGAYLPGERKDREYEWTKWGINPEKHSFGYTPITNNENVAECLKETRDLHLVSKVVSDHRGFAKDRLGRAKNLGQESDGLREGRPAGWKSKKGQKEPSAAECIAGMYTDEDCLPDKDLGRSLRPGWRNITDDPERSFGCPTIRKDLKAPKQRSFGDGKNYGDASESAHLLLHPSQFASLGIDDTEFTEARSIEELRELTAGALGLQDEDDEAFAMYCGLAERHFGQLVQGGGGVSVLSLRAAVNAVADGTLKL